LKLWANSFYEYNRSTWIWLVFKNSLAWQRHQENPCIHIR